jgi:hypothetical protein
MSPGGTLQRILVTLVAAGAAVLAAAGRMPPPEMGGVPAETTVSAVPDTITVRVLNGSGRMGLARRIQRLFMGTDGPPWYCAPFDPADADRDDYTGTVIVSHVDGAGPARAAAAVLGLGDSSIVWELDTGAATDLTIYLGRDVADRQETLIPVDQY